MAAAISHTMGLGMLLHVAGPHRFQKGPIRRAFESARASLVSALPYVMQLSAISLTAT